jgi:hypothetical protein
MTRPWPGRGQEAQDRNKPQSGLPDVRASRSGPENAKNGRRFTPPTSSATATARRSRQRISAVLLDAIAQGIAPSDPAEKWAVLKPLRKGRRLSDRLPEGRARLDTAQSGTAGPSGFWQRGELKWLTTNQNVAVWGFTEWPVAKDMSHYFARKLGITKQQAEDLIK